MELRLPSDFIEKMKSKLTTDYPLFEQALNEEPPVSIRYNALKKEEIPRSPSMVPWCDLGCYLPQRPVFTIDPLFHAGTYYVQEASSMWISKVMETHCSLEQPLKVLDLCAAPGGKSTLIQGLISRDSVLISNEIVKNRVQILKENLVRWGGCNVILTNHEPADFEAFGPFFDLILVDAPCSGEGMFRKDPKSINEWSLENVKQSANRQRQILQCAISALKPNGLLIYSTCTYNRHENEENVQWLAEKYQLEECILTGVATADLEKREVGYQCYPHRIKGEGFYFAALRSPDFHCKSGKCTKKEPQKWLPLTKNEQRLLEDFLPNTEAYSFRKKFDNVICMWPKALDYAVQTCEQNLTKWAPIQEIGEIKGKCLIPSHGLALSTLLSHQIPDLDLNRQDALHYLKKEQFPLSSSQLGWHTVSFAGQKLGWIKILGNRYNNYLPNHLKIRMDIPTSDF